MFKKKNCKSQSPHNVLSILPTPKEEHQNHGA